MTDLCELLDAYDEVIQRYRTVLEKELASLQKAATLDETLIEAKQAIIKELDARLKDLKVSREAAEYIDSNLKSRFDQVQHKFMQVIKLDREVEKAYLGRQSGDAEQIPGARGWSDRAAARRLYGMSPPSQ